MSSATSAAAPTPTLSRPFGSITSNNSGGLIAIITALSFTFVLVSFLIRIYVRYQIGPWKRDDNALTAATVVSCAQSVLVFFAVGKGLGKIPRLLSESHQVIIKKEDFANNILYILILFLTKCSVGFLYQRLTPARGHKIYLWVILGVSAVWTVMSILLVTVDCSWSNSCGNIFPRWAAIGAIDIVTELALFMMSIYLVKGLQMHWKPKAVVVAAFGTRLLVIPAIALRLHYLNPSTLSSKRTLANTFVIVCSQLQLGYGIMAATIPCLKPFVAVYEQPSNQTNTYYGNGSGNFKLSSYNSASRSRNRNSTVRGDGLQFRSQVPSFRPDQPAYTATISRDDEPKPSKGVGNGGGDNLSIQSHDSRKMIIEQKTDWSVRYDPRTGEDEPDEALQHGEGAVRY